MFGSVTQVKRGVSQQIIGMNPQDRTFTRHLNSPRRETVDDRRSYHNQRACVARRMIGVPSEAIALHADVPGISQAGTARGQRSFQLTHCFIATLRGRLTRSWILSGGRVTNMTRLQFSYAKSTTALLIGL